MRCRAGTTPGGRADAVRPDPLPRRFRAFYRLDDAALAALGLDRRTLPLFLPRPPLRREDLF